VLAEMNLSLHQAAFVGNDVNDEPCLSSVALPIVVRDAHPDVRHHARYVTRARGGYGAVREICDLFEFVWTRGS
jgi:YrbI family 3-deoxy-D-manno-octulosonate 8-phosphate phosphatase